MDGIYKASTGSWLLPPGIEAESPPGEDTLLDLQIDGEAVVPGDRLNIHVITEGDEVPLIGTRVYVVGVNGVPDGFYEVCPKYTTKITSNPNDDYDPGIQVTPVNYRRPPAPFIIDSQSIKESN